MKYFIDTDPGIDDSIAILLAVLNGLKIVGFSIATGNLPIDKCENNLKTIEEFLKINVPIYLGRKENKHNPEYAKFAHGIDGMGYAVFPISKRVTEKTYAENAIIKYAKKYKDNLTIICLGPLTNLANALRKDKKLAKRIKHLVIMGAAYDPSCDPYLEFNVRIDPDAAREVFSSGIEDIKVITHEIGVKSYIDKDYVIDLKNSEDLYSRLVSLIGKKYIDFSYEHYQTEGLGCPDPTTVASIIDEKIIKYLPAKIDIYKKDDKDGYCDVTILPESNLKIAIDVDVKRFEKLFKQTFK